jgi:hypothetical protein
MARSRDWWARLGYSRKGSREGTDFWVKGEDDPEGQFLEDKADEERGSPDISLTISPTRTSNPGRPRTTAMGYDYKTDTLRVQFREGAVYDYFDVSTAEWWRMRRSASPGKFINRVLPGKEYTRVE